MTRFASGQRFMIFVHRVCFS